MAESYHAQIISKDSLGKHKIYPVSKAEDVIVDPANNIPTGDDTVEKVLNDLGELAFKDTSELPAATTSTTGVVQLATSLANDVTRAATPKMVKAVNDSAVKTTGDQTVNGMKNFAAGLQVAGAIITSETNTEGGKTLTISFN